MRLISSLKLCHDDRNGGLLYLTGSFYVSTCPRSLTKHHAYIGHADTPRIYQRVFPWKTTYANQHLLVALEEAISAVAVKRIG